MVIYEREKKELIIPEGLGGVECSGGGAVDCSEAIAIAYQEGYNKGYTEAGGDSDIVIKYPEQEDGVMLTQSMKLGRELKINGESCDSTWSEWSYDSQKINTFHLSNAYTGVVRTISFKCDMATGPAGGWVLPNHYTISVNGLVLTLDSWDCHREEEPSESWAYVATWTFNFKFEQ